LIDTGYDLRTEPPLKWKYEKDIIALIVSKANDPSANTILKFFN
jgi:hypothetical protein